MARSPTKTALFEAAKTWNVAAVKALVGAAPALVGLTYGDGGGVCGGVAGAGTPAARLAARNAVCESWLAGSR